MDFDILRYQVGFSCEFKDEVMGFDKALEYLDNILHEIQEATDCDEPPTLYITADENLVNTLNKRREVPLEFKPNFRESLAKTKPYKGQRTGAKPFHFDNLTHHILNCHDTRLAIGIEADDLISIDHLLEPDTTVICSRDKDLRITPGYHYGWTCGYQPAFGPRKISKIGFLELNGTKLKGGGLKFFYSQMLMGDTVDNIAGIRGFGPKKTYELLKDCETEEELFRSVAAIYIDVVGESWREYYKEMSGLLYMIQELDMEGNPVHYITYDERKNV